MIRNEGFGIVLDASRNAYVTGRTSSSTNFPTTTGAFDTTFNGGGVDAFVTKLDPTGSTLLYSTFLGGSGDDVGDAYVTGLTRSADFPTTARAFQAIFGGSVNDAFVTNRQPHDVLPPGCIRFGDHSRTWTQEDDRCGVRVRNAARTGRSGPGAPRFIKGRRWE